MSNQLQAWLDAESAQRQRLSQGPGAGVLPLEKALNRSGLEMMQAMMAGTVPYASIGQTLDFLLIEIAHGRAVFQGTPGPSLTVLVKSRHYTHFFEQEVSLDGRVARVRAVHGALE